MTGTGTQADPYVVNSWSEFISKCGEAGVYITCPENSVWDMNEIYPLGFTKVINFDAKQFEGNNLTIKNLYLDGGYINTTKIGRCYIDHVTFCNISSSHQNNHMFRAITNNYNHPIVTFRNCKFDQIELYAGALFLGDSELYASSSYAEFEFTNDGETSCFFNMSFYGSARITNAYPYDKIRFYNCLINLGGDSTATEDKTSFYNCYIKGKIPFTCYGLKESILDAEVNKAVSGDKGSVYNKDISNLLLSSFLAGVTTQQLEDANYLQSIGFSIATE